MERRVTKEIKNLDKLIGETLIDNKEYAININHTQIQIIFYLIKHKDEDVCQKDLEIETHLKKASITGTLDSMEDKGFIIRKQSEEDKRKNNIILSDKILKEQEKLKNRINEIETRINKNISEDELNQFFTIIDKIKANLK